MSSEKPPRFVCGDCGFSCALPSHRPPDVCPACGWHEGAPARTPPPEDGTEDDTARDRECQGRLEARIAELHRTCPSLADRIRTLLASSATPPAGGPDGGEDLNPSDPILADIREENQALRNKLRAAERTLRTAARIAEQVASLHNEIDRLGTQCLRSKVEANQARTTQARVEEELSRILDQVLSPAQTPPADVEKTLEDLRMRVRRAADLLQAT